MGTGSGIVVLLWFVLAILWLLVPFAVFGIKGLLRQILAEQRRTNDLLAGRNEGAKIPEYQPPKQGIFG